MYQLIETLGFILHHKILWEGSDTDIAVSVINETQALHRDLRVCSFDRGFHSPGNRAQLDAMLDLNALPRKGRLSVADREREEAQPFAEARRQHPAVESAINNLEHRGLDRVQLPRRRWVCAHRCIVDTGREPAPHRSACATAHA